MRLDTEFLWMLRKISIIFLTKKNTSREQEKCFFWFTKIMVNVCNKRINSETAPLIKLPLTKRLINYNCAVQLTQVLKISSRFYAEPTSRVQIVFIIKYVIGN